MASFVWALARLKNVRATRSSVRPERSSGRIVFSNVAGADWEAMASISSICSAIPRSNAGP